MRIVAAGRSIFPFQEIEFSCVPDVLVYVGLT